MLAYNTKKLFNFPLYSGTTPHFVQWLTKQLSVTKHPLTISTLNPEQIILAKHNTEFRSALKKFAVYLPDGQGLVWASKKFRQPLPSRIAGVDVVTELLILQKKADLKIMLIGGTGYLPEIPVSVTGLVTIPDSDAYLLWIAGYQDIAHPSPQENQAVLDSIRHNQPDIIFVALGAPYQEQWVATHLEELKKNKVKCVMVVGGAFDMILGKLNRAPTWVQRRGLEWLFRLIQEPWRWKRQLKLVEFVIYVFQLMRENK